MEFTWPFMLGLLVLLPLFVLFYFWVQRRRQRHALRFANLSLVKEALDKGPGWRRHIPPMLMLAGLAVMIVAMARPVAVITMPAQDSTVILTLDVSGSMAADDLHPTRMEAAKAAARTFVDHQPDGVQIGIVSFSDQASVIQSPTSNRDAVLAAIDRLQPEGGTAIGSAIKVSLNTLMGNPQGPDPVSNSLAPDPQAAPASGTFGAGFIVLLTDGENTWGPPPMDAAQTAADKGVRIYTVGVGSADGTVLHINGQALRAGLDEATLKAIAQMTNAKYYNALSETDLQSIYQNLSARLVLKTERTEITAYFTALAALVSIIAAMLSMLWFNRFP